MGVVKFNRIGQPVETSVRGIWFSMFCLSVQL
jgi:hypothetical protein